MLNQCSCYGYHSPLYGCECHKGEAVKNPVSESTVELKQQISDISRLHDNLNEHVTFKVDKRLNDQTIWLGQQRDTLHVLKKRIEALEVHNENQNERNVRDNVRIKELEAQVFSCMTPLCVKFDASIEKLEARMSSQEKFYSHQEVKLHQKCNPATNGAVGEKTTLQHAAESMAEKVKQDIEDYMSQPNDEWNLRCNNCSTLIIRCHTALYRYSEFEIYCEKCAVKIDNHNPKNNEPKTNCVPHPENYRCAGCCHIPF